MKKKGKKLGRPPKPKAKLNIPPKKDPKDFLLAVMNDPDADPRLRVRAAVRAIQYTSAKKGESGKKDERAEAAERAASGKYAQRAGPRLRVVGGSA